jgi:uncharacterized protein (TIGR03437 family)
MKAESGKQKATSVWSAAFRLLPSAFVLAAWMCFSAAWAQFGTSTAWVGQGPIGIPTRIVALAADPRSDSTLYLAAGGGIWKSSDGGMGWVGVFDLAAPSAQTCSVALDPTAPNIIYAGTGDNSSPRPAQGVARSADGGQSWTIGVRFTNRPVCLLGIDPQMPARVFAGSSEGLFVSSNAATSWKKVLSQLVTDISFDGQGSVYAASPTSDSAGLRQKLLWRSSDAGATWSNVSLPVGASGGGTPLWVNVLARGNAVYVALGYRQSAAEVENPSPTPLVDFYRSTDAGATWTLIPNIGTGAAHAALFAGSSGTTLYLAGQNLQYSQNQGATWFTVSTSTQRFSGAAFSQGLLVLAGEQGLEAVLPPGSSGPAVETAPPPGLLPGPPAGRYLTVAYDALGQPWVAGSNGLAFFDSALSLWEAAITENELGRLVIAPNISVSGTENIFVVGGSAFYLSHDAGRTFALATPIPVGQLRAPAPPLMLNSGDPSDVFVAGRLIYRSQDDGVTWSEYGVVDSDPSRVVIAMAQAQSARQILYAVTACLPEVATTGTCQAGSTIWRSTNYGSTWTRLGSLSGYVSDLAVDPRMSGAVYAAVGAFPGGPSSVGGYQAGDLLRTLNGQSSSQPTWTSLTSNLPRVPINAIMIDSSSPGSSYQPASTVYVGTDAGVFVTYNAGNCTRAGACTAPSWTPINKGLPPVPITDLVLQSGALRVATWGRGIYQASVGGSAAGIFVTPLSFNATVLQGASVTLGASLTNATSSRIDWTAAAFEPWLSVTTPSGGLASLSNGQLGFQISSAGLEAGTYLGRVRLTTVSQTQDILITLQVAVGAARLTVASGNNAVGPAGSVLPPLVVQMVGPDGAPIAGAAVSFAITSGGGSLSTRSAVTDTDGRASTVLTLPNAAGDVRVLATSGASSVTFTATVVQPVLPGLVSGAAVNGASFNRGAALAPGTIISIFGANLALSTASAPSLPLPISLAGTRVLVGETPIPLFYVSPAQINALLPYELVSGTYQLSVESRSGRGPGISVLVSVYAPGIFTVSMNGSGQGIFVLAQDGSLVSNNNPARRGSVISIYATGLGAVDPPVTSGDAANAIEPLNRTLLTPMVRFDTYDGEVLYSGLAPGFAGLYQINVKVPAGVSPAYNIPVSLAIGGAASNRVTIPIQ